MSLGPPHSPDPGPVDDQRSRDALLGEASGLRAGRRFYRRVPSDPRCNLCNSPFAGPGGFVMRRIGKGPWPKNPRYCIACFKQLRDHRGGAEIECSFLFADVRGSTTLAEGMRPGEFRALMQGFFETAAHVLFEYDGFLDKFVGDEVIAIFIPALAGELHARRAVGAGRALLTAVSGAGRGPAVPIGVGVHTGLAYVGTVGEGDEIDLTAMGDPVNVTARLAAAAGAGELLATTIAAAAAGIDLTGVEHRQLALKGKSEPTEVVVLGAAA